MRRTPRTNEELEEAQSYRRLAIRACRKQYDDKEMFLFEHPRGAKSWEDTELQALMELKDVDVIDLDMCCFGLTSCDGQGEDYVVNLPEW